MFVGVSEFDWRLVFEQSATPMSVVDIHGRHVASNAAFANLFGYSAEQLKGLDIGRLTRREDQTWTASYVRQLATGAIDEYRTVKEYVRSEGTAFEAELRCSPIRNSDGFCEALLGIITPVEARPAVSDARVRRVLELSQAVVTIMDRDGRILETTGRYRMVLGYPLGFWESRTIFDILERDDVKRVAAFSVEVFASPGTTKQIEVTVRAADGTLHQLLVYAMNLLDDPDVNGILLTTEDVTEERRLVAALAERSHLAESIVEAQTNVLATVAHELRNPLHALQGLAELLVAGQLPESAASLARTLQRQLSALTGITQDLLDTARVDAGAVVLSVSSTDLWLVVEDVVEHGRAAVGKRPLDVESVRAADVPQWVLADPTRLRQILRNLVGNAVKFTKKGSVRLDVRRAEGETVVFSVIDTGVGIPAEEIGNVLTPFATGSTAGSGKGAGLGLAIVQRFVSAMGGKLSIVSELGKGTTFRIEVPLPLSTEMASNQPSEPTSEEATGTTVLVVEDTPDIQQLAKGQLRRLGMNPVIAESGEAALALLMSHDCPPFDVVLMDYQLPGIDGIETTQRIRTLDSRFSSLPVIGVTASASAAHRKAFVDAGMDGFIAKPATLDQIRRAIADALAVGRTRPTDSEAPVVEAAAEEPPRSAAPGVLDREVLRRLVDDFGDRAVVTDLVEMFLVDLVPRMEVVLESLQTFARDPEADMKQARRAAHTLKSSARMLGALSLADACQLIESGQCVDVDELQRLVAASVDELTAWKGATE